MSANVINLRMAKQRKRAYQDVGTFEDVRGCEAHVLAQIMEAEVAAISAVPHNVIDEAGMGSTGTLDRHLAWQKVAMDDLRRRGYVYAWERPTAWQRFKAAFGVK